MTTAARPLGVVGADAFGTALAALIAERGREVMLYPGDRELARQLSERRGHDRLPGLTLGAGVQVTSELAELARRVSVVILAVPSICVMETAHALGDVLDGSLLVVHAVGAFADGARVSEVLRRETCVRRIGVLAGPALPEDLAEGRSCSMVVASVFEELVTVVRASLGAPPVLRVYGSHDLAGVELASAYSGVLTFAVGLADGMDSGPGMRAVLVTRGLAEAARLGRAVGAEERTFHGLAGLGNVLVRTSSSSARSEDYQLGLAVARGKRSAACDSTEGTRAVVAGLALARRLGVRTPLIEALAAVLEGHLPLDQARAQLEEHVADEE